MAYRYGNRTQIEFFPPSIEDYVSPDAPVRAYDVMIEALDLDELGIMWDPHKVGNSCYDPKAMLKLLVYGYSYGVRSSRKLEREANYNVSFMWLRGGLRPDHKTISEFRRNNKRALKKVLQQCARLCIRLDLIEGNTLFVDGSKIRANASINNSWTQEKCDKRLKKIDKRIEEILSECEEVDQAEQGQASLVKMNEELQDQEILKAKVDNILAELNAEQKPSTNTTDSDCTRIHGRQGSHAGYNGQNVVDEKHGLIVHSDVVNDNNDSGQFAHQIDQANKTLEKKCQEACGDAGYANCDELEKIDAQDIKVIVPSQKQVRDKKPKPFDKCNFQYDKEKDCYICPQGQKVKHHGVEIDRRRKKYYVGGSVCQACCHFGVCTTNRIHGRKITRLLNEEVREKLELQYQQTESQRTYRLRKGKVELPFGHMKHNLKVSGFLLRGLEGVRAEMSLFSTCFNMARMISIIGVQGLLTKLAN